MENISLEDKKDALWKALIFIQNNFNEEITLKEIAKVSEFSSFYFHRLFKEFTNETVMSYIRRLRLERAAFLLKTQDDKIVDIAFESGYYAHESFSRAFYKRFGKNPLEYKKEEHSFNDCYLENITIIYLKKRDCIFKRYIGAYEKSGIPTDNNSLWYQLSKYLPTEENSLENLELFGISYDDPVITKQKNIRYDACIALDQIYNISNTTLSLKEGFYIMADHKGSFEALTDSYRYLIYKWLPFYDYVIDKTLPPFEKFILEKNKDKQLLLNHLKIFIPLNSQVTKKSLQRRYVNDY